MTTPRETDVLVIGGGGAGCSAALHLARRGAHVVLLERGLVGSQASGSNYGGVRQQGRHPAELPVAKRSHELWKRLPQLIGTDCEFVQTGHLKLARSEAEAAELAAYLDVARSHALELQLLGRAMLRARYPWLGPSVVAASFAPGDGSANPRLLAPALAQAARESGAAILEHTAVTACHHGGGRFLLETAAGPFTAPRLLNTAGFWGGQLAASFGEPVPIRHLTPNMMVTEPVPYFIRPNIGVAGGGVYMRQIPRGNIIIGGGHGTGDPSVPMSRPSPEVTLQVMQRAVALVPDLAGVSVIRSWSGIDGILPDKIPVVGPSLTTPGLFHAFGFSGHGFQLGPAIGAILCELALDGRTETPLDGLSIGRFARAALPVG
ncbi:NAD(P)/FAD-dependent oxidoreductase [Belnapia rosea]|uniref:NAD(P)/FAD-dependent oxidoreductase n=1 Tax=Belnapia rosea TaxID=938405 RepID=UPI00088CB970|nr:FAD-binding oxidoreductase [Belnapia rosea]SDB73326.1 sarcosine oxidase subunit beta [Belnapia rosea]